MTLQEFCYFWKQKPIVPTSKYTNNLNFQEIFGVGVGYKNLLQDLCSTVKTSLHILEKMLQGNDVTRIFQTFFLTLQHFDMEI